MSRPQLLRSSEILYLDICTLALHEARPSQAPPSLDDTSLSFFLSLSLSLSLFLSPRAAGAAYGSSQGSNQNQSWPALHHCHTNAGSVTH